MCIRDRKYATEHQRVVFDGNGYSDAWVEEAERRGLPNIRSMAVSYTHLDVYKRQLPEGLRDVALTRLAYPEAALKELADTVVVVKEAGADASVQAELLTCLLYTSLAWYFRIRITRSLGRV